MPHPSIIFETIYLNIDFTQTDVSTGRILYDLLNKKGKDKNSNDQTGGLGSVFLQKTRWHEQVNKALTIDDKKKTAYIKSAPDMLALAKKLNADYSYESRPGSRVIKKVRNENKAALCLAVIVNIQDPTQIDTVHETIKLLKTLFQNKPTDGLATNKKINDSLNDIEMNRYALLFILDDRISSLKNPTDTLQGGKPLISNPAHVENANEQSPKNTDEAPPKLQDDSSPEGSPNALEMEMYEQHAEGVPHAPTTPAVTPSPLDQILQNLNEKRGHKKVLQSAFIKAIQSLTIPDLDKLNEKMNTLQETCKKEKGKVDGTFFTQIRRERWNVFGGGNTRSWKNIRHAVKTKLMDQLETTYPQGRMNNEEYAHYYTLFSQHSGRVYQRLFKPKSLQNFEQTFREDGDNDATHLVSPKKV